MRFIKQCTAILLTAALTLTLTLTPVCSSAESPAVAQSSDKLEALGILEREEAILLESGNALTRGEFIRMMVRLSDVDTDTVVGVQYRSPFRDVKPSDANYKFLCAAYETGLVEGERDAELCPDAPVTYDAAAKLLVTVLGYKTLAEANGGYPAGYRMIANSLKLFAGSGASDEITGTAAAVMIENALDTPLLLVEKFGTEYRFATEKESTLLQHRFRIYRADGILDGTEFTTLLTAESSVRKGDVAIGGVSYAAADSGAEQWLGYYVEAYYIGEDEDDRTLLYLTPKKNKNKVIQLDAEDISSIDLQKITYNTETGKQKTLNISRLASLIYNGKQFPFSSALFQTDCGKLTLIDNNGDGTYEILVLNVYRTIVVSSASARTHIVTDYLGGESIELDPQSSEYSVNIVRNGVNISADSLSPWDVLSYAESIGDGKQLKTVLLSKKSVSGVITTLSADGKRAKIADAEYDVAASLMNKIDVGDENTFYLDVFGRIVAASGKRDIVYGFVKAGKTELFDKYILKIFTENNRWVQLPLRGKLRLNGTPVRAEEAYKALMSDGSVVPQMVTYLVADDGAISELNIAQDIAVGSEREQEAIESNIFRKSMTLTSAAYRNYVGSMSFEDTVCIESARVFMIPPNPAAAKDDEFSAGGASMLAHDNSYTNVVLYDMDNALYAGACTVDRKVGIVDNGAGIQTFMLVTDIGEAVNDFGESVYTIEGMYGGSLSEVYTADKNAVDSMALRKGDVVQFGKDDNGDAVTISRQYNAADGFTQKSITGAKYATMTVVRGQVKNVDMEKGRIVIDYGSSLGVYRLGNASVYLYNPIREYATGGTFSDIAEGDYIFLAARYLTADSIILFKEY